MTTNLIDKDQVRRPKDHAGMTARKKALRDNSHKKNDKCITRNRIQKRLDSSEAMLIARDSAKGNLSATIVYIDLLHYLPLTLPSLSNPNKPEKAYKIPDWRHLSDNATFCFYQLAASEIESTTDYALIPFTFNLSQYLWEAAEASKRPDVTYLQHLIQTALKRALNRNVDFFFAYEVVASAHIGKPHLHGSILATASELRRVRMVLHQLNGAVSKEFKKFAVRFSAGVRRRSIEKHGALHSNLYWALYCMKERGGVRWEYLINQQTYTATQDITKAAKAYHALCYAYEQSPPIPSSKQSIKALTKPHNQSSNFR